MTLTTTNISVGYGRREQVLQEVTLAFASGRITAIVGPNGAGKSTLLRALGGLHRVSSGQVFLRGEPMESVPVRDRAESIAYVAQRPTIASHFSVREVVTLGRYAIGRDTDAVDRAIHRLQLEPLADRWFHELSIGQQHRVAFARALAQIDGWAQRARATGILLADEPLAAMDPMYALAIMQILRSLALDGVCVVVVVHDVCTASQMCDDAVLLSGQGRVVSDGSVETVLTPEHLQAIFGVRYLSVQVGESTTLALAPER